MQVTREEFQDMLLEAVKIEPEEFTKHIVDYIPEGLWYEFLTELTAQTDENIAARIATGFHLGWILSERIINGSRFE